VGRNDAVSFRLDEGADRRKKREEKKGKEAPFHLETATKNIEPFRSLPLLSRDPRSSDTQEVHFDIVRRLSTAFAKSCRLHRQANPGIHSRFLYLGSSYSFKYSLKML